MSLDDNVPISKVLVVRSPCREAGKSYAPGDLFPWHQLSISHRRARQLIGAGWLREPGPEEEKEGAGPDTVERTMENGVVEVHRV